MAKAVTKPSSNSDPFNLHHRTEQVYDWLLSDWEDNPDIKNRADAIKILQYGGMFLTRNIKLKDAADEPLAGSAVRRYSGAFKTSHVTGSRKTSAGPTLIVSDTDDPDTDPDAA